MNESEPFGKSAFARMGSVASFEAALDSNSLLLWTQRCQLGNCANLHSSCFVSCRLELDELPKLICWLSCPSMHRRPFHHWSLPWNGCRSGDAIFPKSVIVPPWALFLRSLLLLSCERAGVWNFAGS